MQRASAPTKLSKRAIAPLLMLLAGIGVFAALLVWLKVSGTNALGLSLPTELQDLVTLTLGIVVEALPFVFLGALVSAVIRLVGPAQRLIRLLPKRPLFRHLAISFVGAFMPVCECGNLPVARGLMLRGLSVGESTTFLLAAPIINPVTILTTSQAFGLDPSITWLRVVGALLIANLVGGLVDLCKDKTELVSKGFYNTLCEVEVPGDHANHHDHGHHHASNKWQEGIVVFRDEVSLMLKMLCLGAVIAASTQVFVPRDVLTSLGGDPFLSILAMIALAFIISICSNVDAFFALAYSNTFTTGSIVAFLVFGPMIDIKMLAMMRTTYKTRLLVMVTLLVTLSSVFIGLGVNYAL